MTEYKALNASVDYDEEDDVTEDSDGPGIIQDEITEDDELLPNLNDGDES